MARLHHQMPRSGRRRKANLERSDPRAIQHFFLSFPGSPLVGPLEMQTLGLSLLTLSKARINRYFSNGSRSQITVCSWSNRILLSVR